jgi:hypothetical protein
MKPFGGSSLDEIVPPNRCGTEKAQDSGIEACEATPAHQFNDKLSYK